MAEFTLAMPALLGSVVALAVGGLPHCAVMCGAPCAAVCGSSQPAEHAVRVLPLGAAVSRGQVELAFHLARLVSYATVGAMLAAGLNGLGQAAASGTRLMQPLWTLWHAVALLYGLVMLVAARQPLVERWGRMHRAGAGPKPAAGNLGAASLAGLAWAAWPCGLLHAALLVASLANTAWGGAALMLVFGAISAWGVAFGPALRRALGQRLSASTATRWAGALLSAAALWALADRSGFVAWCLSSR